MMDLTLVRELAKTMACQLDLTSEKADEFVKLAVEKHKRVGFELMVWARNQQNGAEAA